MVFAISWRSSTKRHGDFLKAQCFTSFTWSCWFLGFVGVCVGCCFFVFLVLLVTKVVVSHVFSLWEYTILTKD